MKKRQEAKLDEASVKNFGDYEVIVPKHNLRTYVHKVDGPDDGFGGIDPEAIERAEAALAQLAAEFDGWMEKEVERLVTARDAAAAHGLTAENRTALFSAAHDIKGEATTFGYPLASRAAESLTALLLGIEDAKLLPWPLVSQHVDAIRAIVREEAKGEDHPVALELVEKLVLLSTETLVDVTGVPPLSP
ncbi:Hpt domain-containing protein [Phreatobacter sp. AB_2022a]|uniref:Hpt domain-containing protein n=1 Tax=Phreatobacter sp. AB_2022a TaxID=3003134 RepID=UPI000579B34C|nr:Hpt domain-containing protein [Phreatobacter sp. AB_2022a]MCZ0738724.1 Hpt domain-containing protein [Phreatobacter sp. AB_2022a]CEJ12685.1 Hpt domain protein [bacterium YEK0313]